MLPLIEAVPSARAQLAPERVGMTKSEPAPARVEALAPRSTLAPIAAQRFPMHVTMSQRTHEKLRYAQELLSHRVVSGDIAEVLDRALDALIAKLEKRKFAATDRPRKQCRPTTNERTIPASVKRDVWQRDGGACTFVSDDGKRCDSRTRLEFDHIEPVARGGEATVANLRLRCRAHNQFEAERAFGEEFMIAKRAEARRAAAEKDAATKDAVDEVVPWLRQLGCSKEEARRAAAHCESIAHAPLEERVRVALRQLGPRGAPPGSGHCLTNVNAASNTSSIALCASST
jgi:5-methylcytosine-specific restriction endonuclease McrA